MLFLVKPGLEGKLPVCSQASSSLLRISRKTARSSTYASAMLSVLMCRPVNVLFLGGHNGLEVKVHTLGNRKLPLKKSAKPAKMGNKPTEELNFTFALDRDCESLFKKVDSHCLSNTGVFKGGKAAVFFQNEKDD